MSSEDYTSFFCLGSAPFACLAILIISYIDHRFGTHILETNINPFFHLKKLKKLIHFEGHKVNGWAFSASFCSEEWPCWARFRVEFLFWSVQVGIGESKPRSLSIYPGGYCS